MERSMISEIGKYIGEEIYIKGWIQRIRKLKSITFLIIRDRSGRIQCVVSNDKSELINLKLESVVGLYGRVKEGKNDISGYELEVSGFEIICEVKEELPIAINVKELQINLDTMLTTGEQRIHEYDMLIENIKYKNLEPANYIDYTSTFKYGMPPHGGLAIGLERLTAKLIGLENVREASLFPRDRTRLTP